jgi:hypothetical protein
MPSNEGETRMPYDERLGEADRLLVRLLSSMGSGHVHHARLLAAQRELRKANRGGGRDDRRRLVRAVRIMSEVLLEEVLTEQAQR